MLSALQWSQRGTITSDSSVGNERPVIFSVCCNEQRCCVCKVLYRVELLILLLLIIITTIKNNNSYDNGKV